MIFFIYLFGCFIFIALQGLFAASEIAFISANALKLRHRVARGDKKAKLAFDLISNPEKFLATTLIGTNLSVIISSSFATLFLIDLDVGNSNIWITFLFTPIVVVFAELIPKNIGRFYKERFSCKVSRHIKIFEIIFAPLVLAIEKVSRLLIRLLIGKKRKRSLFVTREEIKSILREVETQGGLDRGEKEAIEDVFDFRDTKVKDVHTPLIKIAGLDYTDSYETVLKKAKSFGFTRYPVFKNRAIAGYINIFDLFYCREQWIKLIRPIMKVGESQKLYDVFTSLKTQRENIALVMRGKKALGIVTLEDITREIVTSIVKY